MKEDKPTSGRPKFELKNHQKLVIWTEAAGRCQFTGCNKPLWYNQLTLGKRNFSELAHIIGASECGPRGNETSHDLASNPSNIMLLCDGCHKEVDGTETKHAYSADRLRKMKADHVKRVRMLLDQKAKKTRPLIFTGQIGGQNSMFGERSIQSALLPDYPDNISDDWYKIEINSFDRTKPQDWEVAKSQIAQEVESVNRAFKTGSIEHLSVFGIAAQPLLMYLGRQLGDKAIMQVFEPRRTDDLDTNWAWDEEDGTTIRYLSSKVNEGTGTDVILLLALSDFLGADKCVGMVPGNPHVYQLTIDDPVQGFVKKKSEKAAFIQSCRALLNQIQQEVGRDCTIHVLPAMPASLAVEFGRLIQPTKDPSIWVYENVGGAKPTRVLNMVD